MATQPVLNGVNLPHPSNFSEDLDYRGGTSTKADGTLSISLVQASAKRVFSLEWSTLTGAEKTTIQNAVNGIKTVGGGFTAPDGNSYTKVKMDIGDRPRFSYVHTPNGFRYQFRLTLREE